jgi:hypothetical protein
MLLVLLAVPAICCAALDLDSLLTSLARPAPATTPFIEVRYSKLLDQPLIAHGQLEYLGIDHLARTVTQPFHERTEIDGETVSIQREGQKPRRFSLRRIPQLRSMLASFGAILGGSKTALERDFKVESSGETDSWQLTVTPKSASAGKYVRDIVIHGTRNEPKCVVTTQPDYDASVMLLGKAAELSLPQPLEREELNRLCAGGER